MLQGLIDRANQRIAELDSGERPALRPDDNAKYAAEFVVDLDQIVEPMIADPDVNNEDVSSDTHTTPSVQSLSMAETKRWILVLWVLVWFTKAT